LITRHGVAVGIGLTLSRAQAGYLRDHSIPGAEIRVEDWARFDPASPLDAIVSFGAFEHFARDGMTGRERIARYQAFFRLCSTWLRPGGRLGLETIAHDDANDTDRPRGRGPLGDCVLDLFPESLCPHLSEVVLGFEPWFEVEVLRSDPADFARTFRAWQLRLRGNQTAAVAAAGEETMRTFRRYLAATEVQFRDGTLTNLRLVLLRRDEPRR
jgi:cyclopropane-fatty-acyl-phospholipid synthase